MHTHTHMHYVQGVAWDPLGQYVLTTSCDRSAHVLQNLTGVGGTVSTSDGGKGKKRKREDAFAAVSKLIWWEVIKSLHLTQVRFVPEYSRVIFQRDLTGLVVCYSSLFVRQATAEKSGEDQRSNPSDAKYRMFLDENVPSYVSALTPEYSFV